MKTTKLMLVAILAIAMLVGTASAETSDVSGNVRNVNPFFMQEAYECEFGDYNFIGVGVYSADDFILKPDECSVTILATAGDWNGQSDIETMEFEITKDDVVVIARNEFDSQTNIASPFIFANEEVTITEAGTYKVTIYVNDEVQEITRSKLFTIQSTPKYSASGAVLNGLTPNQENEKTITVTNNWGDSDAYVSNVEVHDIIVRYGDSETFTIPASRISVETVPSATFGTSGTITLTVTVDLTGLAVPDGVISSEPWTITISEPTD